MTSKKLLLVLSTLTFTTALALGGCGDDSSDTGGGGTDAATDTGGGQGEGGSLEGGGGEGGTDGAAPKPLGPIDRMGRAAINTVLIDKTLKDAFNHEDTFAGAAKTDYDTTMDQHLIGLDALDGNSDYGTGTPHRLRNPLKLDTLVVNTGGTAPSSAGTAATNTQYLAVDGFVLFGVASAKAGGRWLTDDVVDISLALLVCGPIRAQGGLSVCPVSDAVDHATKAPTFTFPYVAAPN